MARDLPYFKFFCSEWSDGDITLEDYRIQGLFINVCSYYWSNECDVSLIKLKKKFKEESETIDYLISENLIKVSKENIEINFLDEQLNERVELCNTNKINALKGWKKRKECDRNATATKSQCENDAIKIREEKKREDVHQFDTDIYKKELWTYLMEFASKNKLDKEKVKETSMRAYDYYKELGWKNSKGKEILNLKSTIRQNWFKDLSEFKIVRKNMGGDVTVW